MGYEQEYKEAYEKGRILAKKAVVEKMLSLYPLSTILSVTELPWKQILEILKEYYMKQEVERNEVALVQPERLTEPLLEVNYQGASLIFVQTITYKLIVEQNLQVEKVARALVVRTETVLKWLSEYRP